MLIKMLKEFTYMVDAKTGSTRTLPIGWAGEVSDKIGKRAIKGRFDKENDEYVDGGYAVEVGADLEGDEGSSVPEKAPAEADLGDAGLENDKTLEELRETLAVSRENFQMIKKSRDGLQDAVSKLGKEITTLQTERNILKRVVLENGAAPEDVAALLNAPDDSDLFAKVVSPLLPATPDNEIPSGIKPEAEPVPGEPISADHADFEALTIAELKSFLDEESVPYDAKAKHADLVNLCVGTLNK